MNKYIIIVILLLASLLLLGCTKNDNVAKSLLQCKISFSECYNNCADIIDSKTNCNDLLMCTTICISTRDSCEKGALSTL